MTDLKFKILKLLYTDTNRNAYERSFYDAKLANMLSVRTALHDLIKIGFIAKMSGYRGYQLTPKGVEAYELEEERRNSEEYAENRQRKSDIRTDISIGISIVAMIIAAISLIFDILN